MLLIRARMLKNTMPERSEQQRQAVTWQLKRRAIERCRWPNVRVRRASGLSCAGCTDPQGGRACVELGLKLRSTVRGCRGPGRRRPRLCPPSAAALPAPAATPGSCYGAPRPPRTTLTLPPLRLPPASADRPVTSPNARLLSPFRVPPPAHCAVSRARRGGVARGASEAGDARGVTSGTQLPSGTTQLRSGSQLRCASQLRSASQLRIATQLHSATT